MKPIKALLFFIIIYMGLSILSCNSKKTTTEEESKTTQIIAHRGFWKAEGSAQNSRKALQLAIDHHFYGCEFDVHLTKDNRIVVFHDNEINGITIQKTNYSDLKDLTISNGEILPTLEEYLEIAASQKHTTKLILEVKAHQGAERNKEAAREAYKLIKAYKLEGITEYISFDMDACKEFIALDPHNKVSFLHWDKDKAPTPKELKEAGFYGLDYASGAMKERTDWIGEAHKLGLAVNIWTVNDEEDIRLFIQNGADFITTDEPLLLEKILQEK